MRAIGRLLRVSLAPTAMADVAAGLVLGAQGTWPPGAAPWLLLAASLGVYHGALVLNDWADREHDARTRPDRPIPSGAVSPRTALGLASGLLALGVAAAFAADARAGVWTLCLALVAVGYDLAGRGPLLGPALLGVCRFANMGLGLLAPSWIEDRSAPLGLLAPAALYGAYVYAVSRLGRLEDGSDAGPLAQRPRDRLLGAAACLFLAPFTVIFRTGISFAFLVSFALAWLGARGLVRIALSKTGEIWARSEVERAMGAALRRLLVFSASIAVAAATFGRAGWIVAGAIGLGYPLSFRLRRLFPPS